MLAVSPPSACPPMKTTRLLLSDTRLDDIESCECNNACSSVELTTRLTSVRYYWCKRFHFGLPYLSFLHAPEKEVSSLASEDFDYYNKKDC